MKPVKFAQLFLCLYVLLWSYCLKAQEPKLMLPIGHTLSVLNAQFSPNGKFAITLSWDRTIKIWDVETGMLIKNIQGSFSKAQFLSNNTDIVLINGNGTLSVLNFITEKLILKFKAHNKLINSIQLSADENKIITTSSDSTAKIWDLKSGRLITRLIGHKSEVDYAEFSPDMKKAVSVSWDHTSKIWDANSGKLLIEIKSPIKFTYKSHFSPDSKKIVICAIDSTAKIFDAETGQLVFSLKGHHGAIRSAIFSKDGRKILTASDDNTAKIWDATTGKILKTFIGHTNYLTSATFSTDGKKILTSGENWIAKIWDVKTGKNIANLTGHKMSINSSQFSNDDKYIITGSEDNTAKIWDSQTGNLLSDLKGHIAAGRPVQFSKDGKQLFKIHNNANGQPVSSSPSSHFSVGHELLIRKVDGKSQLIDIELNKVVIDFGYVRWPMNGSFLSPDNKKVVVIYADTSVNILDVATGKVTVNLKSKAFVYSVNFSPDSKRLLVSYRDSTAKIWDATTGTLLLNWKGHSDQVNDAEFSPDGDKVVSTNDYMLMVWDSKTGKELSQMKSRDGRNFIPIKAQFTIDGTKIISADLSIEGVFTGFPIIWDTNSGKLISELKSDAKGITDVKLSSDGKEIVTTSEGGISELWDTETGKLRGQLIDPRGRTTISAKFSPDKDLVVTSFLDGTSTIWDSKKYKLLYSFFPIDDDDYLIIDANSRYDGTEGARKLLYFTCGTEVIGLDQVKDQLWVPNLAERIINGDSINAPKLSDLNICNLIPQVEKKLPKSGYLFKITPHSGGLGQILLFVNEIEVKRYHKSDLVKVSGGYELAIKQQEVQHYFIPGQINPVTVKAYTAKNDILSRGVTVSAMIDSSAKAKPNLYAVMVGVSEYKDAELSLRYAAKDATDLSAAIGISARKLLNNDGKEHVFTYNLTTDKNHYLLPEKKAIYQTLADIGKKATANDILLIFFAGHGVTKGDKKKFYFLSADASRMSATDDPATVGISTDELTDWIQPSKIKAQKRILILDACNSGQAITDLIKIGNQNQNYVAARSDDKAEQIKAIDKLNERSGMFILAASASNQSAYEMGRYSQGLLTYALLKAIKQQPDILEDGKYLNVSRWFGAAEKTVTELANENGNRQQPQIVSAGNFDVGEVNEEVRAKIILSNERPLFTACNLQNDDENIAGDDIGLNKILDTQLNDMSARGSEDAITYIPGSASPDAYSLSGRYVVKNDDLAIKINIRQNNTIKYRFDIIGKKNELKKLAQQVVDEAAKWILANK